MREAVGVTQVIDVSELPPDLAAKKPPAWRRILGAMWFDERIVFIDRSEPGARVHWTDAHEATHAMCAWHEQSLLLDNDETLFQALHEQVEEEANYGAGQFVFQGSRFYKEALKEQVSIRTPLHLHAKYGASRHATLRHYVEEHPDAVALLIAGRYFNADGTIPIWRSVESPDFYRRFGRLRDRLPGGHLRIAPSDKAPLGGIIEASRTALDPPSTPIAIPDADGTKHRFIAEAFFNQHCQFVFVAEAKSRRLGRRIKLAS